MNTPEPCVNCRRLYCNLLYEDDPGCGAECNLGLKMGYMGCPQFHQWCSIHYGKPRMKTQEVEDKE
jgi:hypothetical protein